jgi:hypothetical protein
MKNRTDGKQAKFTDLMSDVLVRMAESDRRSPLK